MRVEETGGFLRFVCTGPEFVLTKPEFAWGLGL